MLKNISLLITVIVLIVSSILLMVDRSENNERRLKFELSDTNDAVVTHRNLWGKWSVITFGFTNCPDVCPTHAAQIGAALYQLGEGENRQDAASQVQAIFISVDHLRDNADNLDRYLKFFHPDYIGYLGDLAQLDQVTESFKAGYSLTHGAGDKVDILHSSLIYITNPYGRVAKQLPFGSSAELIASEVRGLM